jgi:hypothetical protein
MMDGGMMDGGTMTIDHLEEDALDRLLSDSSFLGPRSAVVVSPSGNDVEACDVPWFGTEDDMFMPELDGHSVSTPDLLDDDLSLPSFMVSSFFSCEPHHQKDCLIFHSLVVGYRVPRGRTLFMEKTRCSATK